MEICAFSEANALSPEHENSFFGAITWLHYTGIAIIVNSLSLFRTRKKTKCLLPCNECRHILGKINPTDMISHGCSSSQQLLESRCWEGTLWPIKDKKKWRLTEIITLYLWLLYYVSMILCKFVDSSLVSWIAGQGIRMLCRNLKIII